MRIETKQDECRLVAENDLERYYLENFFIDGSLVEVLKGKDISEETVVVTLTYENEE